MSKKSSPPEEEVITINIQPFLMPISILVSLIILSTSLFFGLSRIATAIDGGGSGVLGAAGNAGAEANAPTPAPTEPGTINIDDDPIKGDRDSAKVAIVEFSDYECPFCQNFYSQTLDSIVSDYVDTGDAIFVYRDLPLNSIHPLAKVQAEGAECIRSLSDDETYYRAHDAFFDGGGKFDRDAIVDLAGDLGVNANQVGNCIDNGDFADEVQGDLDDATAAGINGTPAFIVGTLNDDGSVEGELVSGAQPFSVFQEVIEKYL